MSSALVEVVTGIRVALMVRLNFFSGTAYVARGGRSGGLLSSIAIGKNSNCRIRRRLGLRLGIGGLRLFGISGWNWQFDL